MAHWVAIDEKFSLAIIFTFEVLIGKLGDDGPRRFRVRPAAHIRGLRDKPGNQ